MFDAQVRRRAPAPQRSALRHEGLHRIFRAQPYFNCVAVERNFALRQRKRLARRHAQLHRHQIQTGNRFGDGMFHLEARVHLHEVEIARSIEQEFQRSRTFVVDRLHRTRRDCAHALAQCGRYGRRRRFLDQFLMATLHGTIAFAKMDNIAVAVGEYLYLDVTCVDDGAFENHRGITECAHRFRSCATQQVNEFICRGNQPQAASAPAGSGFDHHRKADALCFCEQAFIALIVTCITGDARYTRS